MPTGKGKYDQILLQVGDVGLGPTGISGSVAAKPSVPP